ncbi:glycosyltransferase family 2 protein [Candidatus Bathyarchaeota archaeon]|nr:glycosyltransferase family 2 protein [Candidatus Bathyarchaeota archaeon]
MQQFVVSIVIPAYNEEKTIGNVISETILAMDGLGVPYEIIVVDDGSTDETKMIASRYKAMVLSNGRNRGKGYALRKGFKHAQGDVIVTMDADGSHKPKEISDLINPLFNGVDITAGSRFLGHGKQSITKLNRFGNFMFNTTITVLTGKRVTDSQSGFRAFKREVLESFNLESLGYSIETEITVKGLKNGFVFQEKPITCEKRKYDVSKLRTFADGKKILKTILKSKFV